MVDYEEKQNERRIRGMEFCFIFRNDVCGGEQLFAMACKTSTTFRKRLQL